jgi:hypothetical protein
LIENTSDGQNQSTKEKSKEMRKVSGDIRSRVQDVGRDTKVEKRQEMVRQINEMF